jgi:hypothetical protein
MIPCMRPWFNPDHSEKSLIKINKNDTVRKQFMIYFKEFRCKIHTPQTVLGFISQIIWKNI